MCKQTEGLYLIAMRNTISLSQFKKHLSNLYQVHLFKDYCPKGLVVEGKDDISIVVTGVSLCLELIQKAIELKADAIVVHHPHGFWDNQSKVIAGAQKQKIKLLLEHDINVFSFHLPMDAQPNIGNNAMLAQSLGLNKIGAFAKHGGIELGWICEFPESISTAELRILIENEVGPIPFWLGKGPEQVKTLALCTGAAPNDVEEIIELGGIDAYLTGEARENTHILCSENLIHFIAAGHHQTEVFGPKALAHWLNQEFQLQTHFINIPNPV